MRQLHVYCHGILAGIFTELSPGKSYTFSYTSNYKGPSISLTMPIHQQTFTYDHFPVFFEGFLPDGITLEALTRIHNIDPADYISQLHIIGHDLSGSLTFSKAKD